MLMHLTNAQAIGMLYLECLYILDARASIFCKSDDRMNREQMAKVKKIL
jgi:hypothetical protein